jgi:hypothetical protein
MRGTFRREFLGQSIQAPLGGKPQPAMRPFLDAIGDRPQDQVTAQAAGWFGAVELAPLGPQFLDLPLLQSGDHGLKVEQLAAGGGGLAGTPARLISAKLGPHAPA